MSALRYKIKTVEVMIRMFCRAHHGSREELCPECAALFIYVRQRIEHCPLKDKRIVCSDCTIHCYHPEQREKIIQVMQYSGRKMIFRHPILAIRHLVARSVFCKKKV